MKKIVLTLIGFCLALQLHAADLTWLTSFPDATNQAQKESKLVFLNFTGSDWCEWCHVLDTNIFSKPEFISYARTNLVMVMLDFPATKKLDTNLVAANNALRDKYKIEGYPTLIALKPDGTVIWNHLGNLDGGPKAIIAELDKAKAK